MTNNHKIWSHFNVARLMSENLKRTYSISSLNSSRTCLSSSIYWEMEWKYFMVLVSFEDPRSTSKALLRTILSLKFLILEISSYQCYFRMARMLLMHWIIYKCEDTFLCKTCMHLKNRSLEVSRSDTELNVSSC